MEAEAKDHPLSEMPVTEAMLNAGVASLLDQEESSSSKMLVKAVFRSMLMATDPDIRLVFLSRNES